MFPLCTIIIQLTTLTDEYLKQIGGITYAIGGVVLVWDDIDRRLLDQKYEDNMRDAVLKLAEQHAKGNQGKVSIRI